WITFITSTFSFVFFNVMSTTVVFSLSLHDALPIWVGFYGKNASAFLERAKINNANLTFHYDQDDTIAKDMESLFSLVQKPTRTGDRKSTRLNSSHVSISYAVFCLKKKKNININ